MDYELMRKALEGNETAAKMYCGSYTLVECLNPVGVFRCKGDIPEGYTRVDKVYDIQGREQPVYDNDGFLLPQFWTFPRI